MQIRKNDEEPCILCNMNGDIEIENTFFNKLKINLCLPCTANLYEILEQADYNKIIGEK